MAAYFALWKTEKASAEGAAYEGEYRGTMFRVTRTTDIGYWPGRNKLREKDAASTRWDGYVADGLGGLSVRWAIVAEQYGTWREALDCLKRFIDKKIDG